jgi:hypothetical protein
MLSKNVVVSYHLNTWGCGIAKFNSILADRLNLRVISFHEWVISKNQNGFLSVSFNEFTEPDKKLLSDSIPKQSELVLVLHSFSFLPLEIEVIRKVKVVISLNSQISNDLASLGIECVEGYAPSMLEEEQPSDNGSLRLFTFGMAHKFELEYVTKVVENYRSLGISPSISLSTALHVGEQPFDYLKEDVESLARALDTPIYFLGFLSDIALRNELVSADAIFRFFPKGVRSNSTSLMASLSLGKVTISNLDQYSPNWLKHFENIVDINMWSLGQAIPKDLGTNAKVSYEKHVSWEKLADLFSRNVPGHQSN